MPTHRGIGALAAAATVAASLTALGLPTPAGAATSTTSPLERARVDAVPTPTLNWQACDLGECATVKLPLDYDQPTGPTIDVALTRIPARDQSRRIGSLFLNPGGPGASGTAFPARAQAWLGDEVLDRFDLIGMDPRGTNLSTNTQCFGSTNKLDQVTGRLNGTIFPVTDAEEAQFIKDAGKLAKSCSSHGKQLASSVSTAEVARDMDVVRRAVGDEKLTYLGFSYGTYLGQVYANMFPDRVRAVAVDGVIDPTEWVGTPATASTPISVRMDSASGASKALAELLRRCAENPDACPVPDPEGTFASVAASLRKAPITLEDPEYGPFQLRYQDFITTTLYALYDEAAGEQIPFMAADIASVQANPTMPLAKRQSVAVSYRKFAQAAAKANAKGYHNELEQVPAVMCSDSRNPASAATWESLAESEDARAPYFGRQWLWGSVFCAGNTWKAHDEDAYTGSFSNVTSAPLLFVGNHHDPATNYDAAVSASKLSPGARLLSSNNWGHTAYGVSACATEKVDAYLVDGVLPAKGTTCTDGRQPFGG